MEDGQGLAHEIWRAFEASPLGQALAWGGVGEADLQAVAA